MKKYYSILLVLILPYISLAQIKIEERVEIAPQNQILPNNPTQNYNFRVEVDWDAEEVQANNHFWNANLQVNTALINTCDEFVTETGFNYGWPTGSNSLELQANAFSYKILVTISGFYNSYQFVDVIFRTYLNNNLRHTFTQRVNSGNWPYYSETRTAEFSEGLFLVEAFHFSIDDELIGYGCFYTVNLRTNEEGSCGSTVVASLEYDPINLTIIKGSEYLTFYDDRTNEDAGSSIQVMPQDFNKIDLRYQNPLRDTVSKIAVVQLESNGIVETDSIEILPAPDDLNVSVYPEEITTGEDAYIDIFIDYCPPSGTKINIEIINGQEYGGLIDPYTNEKTKIITNLDHWFGYAWVDYVADSISAVTTDSVIFRVTTTDPGIVPKEAILIIKPPPIFAYTVPETLGADDTADVIIKHRLEDGTLEDFPPEQSFELAVLDGCVNGNFMVGDSINVYFADALQPVKFVTADELDPEFDKVLIRVGTDLGGGGGGSSRLVGGENEEEIILTEQRSRIDTLRAGFEKMIAEKKAEAETKKKENNEPPIEAPIVTQCALDQSNKEFNWQGIAQTKDEGIEILLGETKYYQAKYVGPLLDKLIIEEVDTPDLNGGLTKDVWIDNPVTIVEGDKLGVYWEKEKPVWNGDVNGANLKKGLIRLIGKHWEPGKKFIVKLTAKDESKSTSITIEVKKPIKISSNVYAIPKYKTDVFGEEFNLDSLIIVFAGKYGVMPQIIKAQMMWESSFKPGYRYEPFPDVTGIQTDYRYTDNRYKIISEANTGTPFIPSNHLNVHPQDYWGFQNTIWEFLYGHSSTLNVDISFGSTLDIYPRKNSKGNFVWFERPAKKWKNKFDQKYKEKIKEEISPEIAIDSALAAANYWLQYVYQDGRMNSSIAQTRMASSYGFLQMTYYKALEDYGYTESDENYPEKLNEIDAGTNFSLKTLLGYLNEELGSNGSFNNTDWEKGFEIVFRYGLSRYNGKWNNDYGLFYLNESRKFKVE